MTTPLRVLVVEDSEADAELLELTLKHGGFSPTMKRVDSASGMRRSLEKDQWDIIISDYSLPGFGGFEALQIYKGSGLDIPFILLSGVVGEDIAAEAMVRGAQDYVMKDRKARLIPAIERELRESVLRREKKESESRFRLMFETMSQGGVYQDAAGRVTSANKAAEHILGLSHDQLLGRTPRDPRWKVVREDGSESPPEDQPAQVALRTGRPVLNVTLGVYHPDEGQTYWVVMSAIPQFHPGEKAPYEVFTTLVDITERMGAEAALRLSEDRFRRIYVDGPLGMATVAEDFRFLSANKAFCRMLGYSQEELTSRNFEDITHPDHIADDRASIKKLLRGEIPIYRTEKRYIRKDGGVVWGALTLSVIRDKDRHCLYSLAMIEDITQEKQAEEDLRESERRYRSLADSLPASVFETDMGGRLTYANRTAFDWFGYTDEDIAEGRTVLEMLGKADHQRAGDRFRSVLSEGAMSSGEYTARRKNGDTFPVMVTATAISHNGRKTGLRGIVVDITERKKAEETLRDSEATLRSFVDALPGPASLIDKQGKALFINQTLARSLGKTVDDVIGQKLISFLPPDIAEQRWQRISQVLKTGRAARFEDSRADRSFINYINPVMDAAGKVARVAIFSLDITERKQSENELVKSDNLLRAVIDSTPDWIFVKDAAHRYVLVNRSYARALNLEPKDLIGREDMEFWPKELCLGDPSQGAKGWHSDDLDVLSGSTMHYPDNTAVLADGAVRDFDTFKIPLRGPSGEVYGVLGYSRDVTERKKSVETIRKSLERAEKILRSTVQAMETIVEYRDPYTAGHQERVTKLACALAEELGLAPDKVDNLRIGGMLHDLGKIYVPAEILSKPGKLTEFEFGILKTHPQVGYDILRSIDFPPEVAAMVAQHHERINGSGYPRGLKGEEICIEARCLGVADVMEAMSSHRPYRPALGIDVALDEIVKNKGIYYDTAVAEACLQLFKEKGFTFAGRREQAVPPPRAQV